MTISQIMLNCLFAKYLNTAIFYDIMLCLSFDFWLKYDPDTHYHSKVGGSVRFYLIFLRNVYFFIKGALNCNKSYSKNFYHVTKKLCFK